MPASDADIDYALSLIFAQAQWGNSPENCEPYGTKAKKVLADILKFETYAINDKLYLCPWILPESTLDVYPVNPSLFARSF